MIKSLFEQFWTAYPGKVSKAEALKAFEKLHPDGAIVETMREYVDLTIAFISGYDYNARLVLRL